MHTVAADSAQFAPDRRRVHIAAPGSEGSLGVTARVTRLE